MAKKPYETQAFRMRNGQKTLRTACKIVQKASAMGAMPWLAGWLAGQPALYLGGSGLMEPSPAKNLGSGNGLEVFFYFLSQGWPGQGVPTYPGQNQTLPPLPPLPECFIHL